MIDIPINTEYIKLDQFLKLSDIIGSGGEARTFISENRILVNNVPENWRGKKLRSGDIISVNNKDYQIVQNGEMK
ncbi:MAG: S4 domain-containing protein YaaA [Acetivibrionales bacterium]|jgi:ribosome-associated protein